MAVTQGSRRRQPWAECRNPFRIGERERQAGNGGSGGTTGYAINPARDLGPRLMHALLPIANKRDSDWPYAWIPVVSPIIGGFLAVLVQRLAG